MIAFSHAPAPSYAPPDEGSVLLAAQAVGLAVEKTLMMVMMLRGGRALYWARGRVVGAEDEETAIMAAV